MKFNRTPLPGVIHVELDVYRDGRGYFLESYHQPKYAEGGIPGPFVQDNVSQSSRNTLRGLHAQLSHAQGKLVHVVNGEIWDVAVDIRPDSLTYKKWYGVILSDKKPSQLYIPVGFAHGFCVLSDTAEVQYKCTDVYDPAHEIHLKWNDSDIGIRWPIPTPILSDKDERGVSLRELEPQLTQAFGFEKSK
jgi:dTDP-4-dehydrorhamnose 3,5-epimerase